MKKNQGFSLVELIVVIAIMAVLVGVLAPAYLRYVEKSRKSTDVSAISDIMAAAEKVAIDPQFNCPNGTTFEVKLDGSAHVKVTVSTPAGAAATIATNAGKEWAEMCGASSGSNASNVYDIKSKEYSTSTITYTGTLQANGSVTWGQKATYQSDAICTFSPDFLNKWFS